MFTFTFGIICPEFIIVKVNVTSPILARTHPKDPSKGPIKGERNVHVLNRDITQMITEEIVKTKPKPLLQVECIKNWEVFNIDSLFIIITLASKDDHDDSSVPENSVKLS